MSTITRFAIRSSGRDLTLVRRPQKVVATVVTKPVATPVTVPDKGAVTVTPVDAVSGDAGRLGVTVKAVSTAKPAKSSK